MTAKDMEGEIGKLENGMCEKGTCDSCDEIKDFIEKVKADRLKMEAEIKIKEGQLEQQAEWIAEYIKNEQEYRMEIKKQKSRIEELKAELKKENPQWQIVRDLKKQVSELEKSVKTWYDLAKCNGEEVLKLKKALAGKEGTEAVYCDECAKFPNCSTKRTGVINCSGYKEAIKEGEHV